jgi:hypothetical protein
MINTSSAVFFSGEALQEKDVTVVILGDIHKDTSLLYSKTNQQLEDLQTIAKKYTPFFIFEDPLTYTGDNAYLKQLSIHYSALLEITNVRSVLTNLSKFCVQEGVPYVSAECRYSYPELSIEFLLKENEKIIKNLLACNNNPIYQKHLDEALEEYFSYFDEYLKNPADQIALTKSQINLLDLSVICELIKALQANKHKLFIIGVGAGHASHISEMLQNILHFKTILQKNSMRSYPILMLPNVGSESKQIEILNKVVKILNEYALDLPQFFEEALKAQPIRSRL